MSTSNFSYRNNLFIVPVEDEDLAFEQELLEDSIASALEADFAANSRYSVERVDRSDNDRSYPGHVFAEVVYRRDVHDDTIEMRAPVIFRGGYYSGANIDYYVEEPEYLGSYETPRQAYLDQDGFRMIRGIERVLSRLTSPAYRVATFSNGESVYQLKKKR